MGAEYHPIVLTSACEGAERWLSCPLPSPSLTCLDSNQSPLCTPKISVELKYALSGGVLISGSILPMKEASYNYIYKAFYQKISTNFSSFL